DTVLPIAAAPAPSTTKTTVKPRMNGRLATTTRRVLARSPSRPVSTLERAERYPGTSGSTHGVITETKPARNATARRAPISPDEPAARRVAARSQHRAEPRRRAGARGP